ncbi:MAG TPA: PPC domain-containing DNA-binding protein [Thermoanaerobaculia bacterium]|nr:PPC domain-containing DNA-binding protein [Thermoanaerobaculia bacterium]
MNLILHTGDDALESIKDFANRNSIDGASFHAIGAFREATVAYWNWDTKQYEHIEIFDQVEVLSMIGNVATSSDGRRLHAHVVLGRRGGATVGGHLIRGIVRPTLEIFFSDAGAKLTRQKDEETGLWLLR